MRVLTLAAALALLLPAVAAAQGATLTVVVTDSATGSPLPDALVTLSTGARATTNLRGTAEFRALPPGPCTVAVTRIGYTAGQASATVPAEGAVRVDVGLSIAPIVLQRLRVAPEALPRNFALRDFYIRKATWGSGYFLSRREFEQQRGAPFSQFLRRVPNSYVVTDHDNQQEYIRFNKSYTIGDCAPTFYVDGQRFPVDAKADIDTEFHAEEIEGIEVYTGARIPPQFNGSRAQCGVIVIWTRERSGAVP